MILTFHFWSQCFMAVLVVGLGFTYLGWRGLQIYLVVPEHPVPYLFICLETLIYLSSIMWFVDVLWTVDRRRRPAILPVDTFKHWPTVDILIPCCKEPTELVKDTILAALWQDYPAEKFTVHVCDDGDDEELRIWIENEQAINGTNLRYIRRVKTPGIPHHAKAGNLNHAISLTTGEFIAIIDADMLIRPEFLRRMLAHFDSSRIAYVQCPQSYYNVPHGDPLGHACTFFYHVILLHRDTRNSAPSVGTGVIFRRKSLEEVGGISTGTLTEDFDTSLKLQSKKWHTTYITDKLQYGLVPTSLSTTLRQRTRWAIGTLQIMVKRNPLFYPGLSWHQRLMYITCGISYVMPLAIVTFITLPLLSLIWDWPVMPTTVGNTSTLVILLIPYLFATRFIIYIMYWGIEDSVTARNRDFQSYIWMAPFLCSSLLNFFISFIKPTSFKVTSATSTKKPVRFPRLLQFFKDLLRCWFHIGYIVLGIGAIIYRGYSWDPHSCVDTFKYASQVLYVLLNIQGIMAPVLYVLFSRPKGIQNRKERLSYNEFGVPIIDPVKVAPKPGKLVWLLELIPLVWGAFYIFVFTGMVTGNTFGCPVYFVGDNPGIDAKQWFESTRLIM